MSCGTHVHMASSHSFHPRCPVAYGSFPDKSDTLPPEPGVFALFPANGGHIFALHQSASNWQQSCQSDARDTTIPRSHGYPPSNAHDNAWHRHNMTDDTVCQRQFLKNSEVSAYFLHNTFIYLRALQFTFFKK